LRAAARWPSRPLRGSDNSEGACWREIQEVVDVLKLRDSKGTIFDHVTVVDKDQLIEKFSKYID